MDILLDITRLVRRAIKGRTLTGIDRVTMAYVRHFKARSHALVRWSGRSFILPQSESIALYDWLLSPTKVQKAVHIIGRGIVLQCFTQHRMKPLVLINTGHIGLDQTDYARLVHRHNMAVVFFVHDLIPMTHPEYCSPGEDIRHQRKLNLILTTAHGIITNSNATLRDLNAYAHQTHQTMPNAKTAWLASGFEPRAIGARPYLKPYFVIVSTIEPRKNHALLLQIWRQLIARLGEQTPHLVIIGQRGWECEHVIDLLERTPHLDQFVTELSHCSDADLATALHHCQALLMPSFAEGYGLPVMEALAVGTPVIASDLPVFREIAGDIPEYINALDGKQWEETILAYAKPNSAKRALQLQRMLGFKPPSWNDHFLSVEALIKPFLQTA